MAKTVREVIKEITFNHLKEEYSFCFGQCLTAVGWVGGTLPELYEKDGMIEMTTADVANGGFVVGAGLQGVRPMYVVRYQGFQWYNLPMIVNYAAKSKEIWGRPCPIFIRSIAMEGGIGPVAGSSHHSLAHRMPGIKIAAPMTPGEYQSVYDSFMKDDEVYYISEHRRSYDNAEELQNVIYENYESDIVLFPISVTRFDAEIARRKLLAQGIKASIIHQVWIKPFDFPKISQCVLNGAKYGGLVLDDDFESGVASFMAQQMMVKSNKKVHTMGLKDRTAGFHKSVDNLPPSAQEIVFKIKQIMKHV